MQSRPSRDRLLDAAYGILYESGLSQLSIDRVSERAGLSRRTFFLHFDSKDQLLASVLEQLRPRYREEFRQWADGLPPGLSVEQRVEAMFRKAVEKINDPGWRGCAFIRLSSEFRDSPGHPVHAAVAEAFRDFEEWLEAEISRGGYADPAMTSRQLSTMLCGIIQMQLIMNDRRNSDALLAALPAILASGRSREDGFHAPVQRSSALQPYADER